VHQSQVSPLDAVIDDVLAGDLSLSERQLAADEVAYSYFSRIRDEIGDDMDPDTSAKLNELAATSLRERGMAAVVPADATAAQQLLALMPCCRESHMAWHLWHCFLCVGCRH
jgi:hypothetical protein